MAAFLSLKSAKTVGTPPWGRFGKRVVKIEALKTNEFLMKTIVRPIRKTMVRNSGENSGENQVNRIYLTFQLERLSHVFHFTFHFRFHFRFHFGFHFEVKVGLQHENHASQP